MTFKSAILSLMWKPQSGRGAGLHTLRGGTWKPWWQRGVVWLKCACIVYNFIFPSVPWSGQIQLSLSFHLYVFYRFVIRESFLHTDVLVLQERTNVSVSINRSPYAHGFKYTQPISALLLPKMSSEACAFMNEIQASVKYHS